MAKVPLYAARRWIPASARADVAKIERMLEKHLENPIDCLPARRVMTGE